MASARLAALLLLVLLPVISEASEFLQRLASRQRSFAGLRYSPQDPAARTLLALDTNHDGSIDPAEVAAFANEKGLDASAATQEFSSIDSNADGVLDSVELEQVLGGQRAAAQAPPTKAKQASLRGAPVVAAQKPEPVVEEPPLAAAGPPAQQPASVAIEAPLAASSGAKVAEAQLVSSEAVAAPAIAASAELISEESRASVREAAQKVAEELVLEEKEEREARQLDRKAAEVRANSTALAKQTVQDALDAGGRAAHRKADELMEKISSLEDQAERAEVRAAALRAKSKMELEEGNQLMAAADQALRPHI